MKGNFTVNKSNKAEDIDKSQISIKNKYANFASEFIDKIYAMAWSKGIYAKTMIEICTYLRAVSGITQKESV